MTLENAIELQDKFKLVESAFGAPMVEEVIINLTFPPDGRVEETTRILKVHTISLIHSVRNTGTKAEGPVTATNLDNSHGPGNLSA